MVNYKLYRIYYNLYHCRDEDCAIVMAHNEEEAKSKLVKLFRGDVHFLEIDVISNYEDQFDAIAINPASIYYI